MSVYIILFFVIHKVVFSDSYNLSSVDETYIKGYQAYSKEHWEECTEWFQESLYLFKLYKTIIINCRIKCKNQYQKPVLNDLHDDLKTYEVLFNRGHCLYKCQEKEFKNNNLNSDISTTILHNMQNRKPYQYLHVCYYQTHDVQSAASAAATFLALQPDDIEMKQHLQTYLNKPSVKREEVVDLEKEHYAILFDRALNFYKQSIWDKTIDNLEEAILEYIFWEENCRVECEHQSKREEEQSELIIVMSNYIVSYLECRQSCQNNLKLIEYDSGVHFLADMLNYLQICYYHLNDFKKAAKSTATYLALMPDDDDMLHNKEIYSTLVQSEDFIENADIINYLKRDNQEKELLKLFDQGYNHYYNGS
ncbi:cartilage-associated protein-like [Achroia grisella]|uniref:cartilage-associated protein-like n=1 Tax=Achroia grisella TaxID=688607 RepID=UPI0027D267A1|nr:cartilage-associated protein-like [Achroia grisella]